MKVDIAIITIRDDEFGAVFDRLERTPVRTGKWYQWTHVCNLVCADQNRQSLRRCPGAQS